MTKVPSDVLGRGLVLVEPGLELAAEFDERVVDVEAHGQL